MDYFTFNIYDMALDYEKTSLDRFSELLFEFQGKHDELKRLQKEIDEANKWIRNQQPDSEWSLLWEHNTKIIESNQLKIKQIIEEL